MLWEEQGFFTSAGQRVSNGEEIRSLLEAIQFPAETAVLLGQPTLEALQGLAEAMPQLMHL